MMSNIIFTQLSNHPFYPKEFTRSSKELSAEASIIAWCQTQDIFEEPKITPVEFSEYILAFRNNPDQELIVYHVRTLVNTLPAN